MAGEQDHTRRGRLQLLGRSGPLKNRQRRLSPLGEHSQALEDLHLRAGRIEVEIRRSGKRLLVSVRNSLWPVARQEQVVGGADIHPSVLTIVL